MTTYKGLRGLTIQTVAGDPSNLAVGDIWYDSVARKIQGAKIPVGAWSTANDLNTTKLVGGSSGTASAAVAFLGTAGPFLANSEEFDGTSWTEVANIPQADVQGEGAGTTSAATWSSGKDSAGNYPVKSAEYTEAATVETVAFD